MFVPVPPPPAHGRPRPVADDDDVLLRRLDAHELYDIHQGLDWCERELRAIAPWRLERRGRVVALRRRWAHRWRAATGRPAISLQAHRAWQFAAILGVGATLVGLLDGADAPEAAAPEIVYVERAPEPYVAPPPQPTPAPIPTPAP